MDHRTDFLNTPYCPIPECVRNSQFTAYTTPAEAGAGILSFLKKEGWSNPKIKALAEYMINQCDGGILESTREVVVRFFANLLKTDPTTLLTSELVRQSFSKTLGSERRYMYLSAKLNPDQAFYIANSFLGKTQVSNLKYDTDSRQGSILDFTLNVIKRICEMKPHYSIQDFLDHLKNPDVST